MKDLLLSLIVLSQVLIVGQVCLGETPDENSRFFANESVQSKAPLAFVLQAPAEAFLKSMKSNHFQEKEELIKRINRVPQLKRAIDNWSKLSISQQIPYLKQVFKIEVEVLGIASPDLSFDETEIPGRSSYFDFDPLRPSPGRVILNPKELEKLNPYASLSLLIHETRHSAQFQLSNSSDSYEASVYRSAFQVQKSGGVKSFCDFLTLANEHEAYAFGNYIIGRLTNWSVDMPDMGTFATQYDEHGKLKLDLIQLLKSKNNETLLESFNRLEMEQCQLLGICK